MAIGAGAVWEVRTTGASTNGAGYDSTIPSAGTDYSQQDAAQLSLTDLAMTTGGTTLTSATGGFTAAMIGNAIQISAGTNFTTGWYFITAHTDTNTVTIDRDATTGSNGSSGTGAVGGALDIITDAFAESFVTDNVCWVESGTYTFTSSVNVSRGFTESGDVRTIGYQTTRGDEPTGTNRPLFAMGANSYAFGAQCRVENIRATGTSTDVLYMSGSGNPGCFYNVKSENSSGSASRTALSVGGGLSFGCEAISTNGFALKARSAQSNLYTCYAHDSTTGIFLDSDSPSAFKCVAYNCGTAFRATRRNAFVECTAEGTSDTIGFDLDSGASYETTICACNINGFTTGIDGEPTRFNYEDWNVFGSNTADTADMTSGNNSTTGGTLSYTDAANDDFTYQSGSTALNFVDDISTIAGLAGTYENNSGFSGNDPSGGGGSYAFTFLG